MSHLSINEYRELVTKGSSVRLGETSKKHAPYAQEEELLQRACFEWLGLESSRYEILRYAFHPANGGKRSKGEAGKLKAMGVKKGVPDVLLPMPWRGFMGLAIELKSSKGNLTAEQGDWLARFGSGGYFVAVCRDLDSFINAVKTFLSGRKNEKGGKEVGWDGLLNGDTKNKQQVSGKNMLDSDKEAVNKEQVLGTLRFARRPMSVAEMAAACDLSLKQAQVHLDNLVIEDAAVIQDGRYLAAPKRRAMRRSV